ncbi:MAG: hypothetical protein Q7S64_00040 [bacterium]|nr:hypothetical protein [bacterium]
MRSHIGTLDLVDRVPDSNFDEAIRDWEATGAAGCREALEAVMAAVPPPPAYRDVVEDEDEEDGYRLLLRQIDED